jgi:Fe(3+) dicitrate transport protein
VRSGIHEETSIGTELGARYNNQKGFRTEAIFFYTDFNDLIVVDNIGGGGTTATQNVGQVSSLGVEYLAEYDLGLAKNWSFSNPYRFSFTYTDAELRSNASSATESDDATTFSFGTKGKKVPYIPEYQFQFGTGLGFTKWDLFADLIFVDETFTTASNTSNQNEGTDGTGKPNSNVGKTDAIWTLDLSAHYKMTENDTFFVNLDNVFDREYVVARHPIGPRPGKPFTFAAGIEKKF